MSFSSLQPLDGNKLLPFKGNRADGVLSVLTGVGTSRDKGESLQSRPDPVMSQQEVDNLYEDNEILHIIIDTIVDDALRNWIDINHKKAAKIQKELKRLKAKDRFSQGKKMERLSGGSCIFMDIDDGQDPSEPLDLNNIKKIRSLKVFERWYIYPKDITRTMDTEIYCIYQPNGAQIEVHVSRLLIFEGESVSQNTRIKNQGWGGSITKRIKRALLGYTMGQGCLPTIVQEFIVDLYKMAGLNEMSRNSGQAAAADELAFKEKLKFMQIARSIVDMVLVDKDDEIVKQTANVQGLVEILREMCLRLSAAAKMPFSKLFGLVMGNSMSAGGDTERKHWEETVQCYQSDKLRSPLEDLITVIGCSLGISEDEDIPFTFRPLTTPTDLEQSNLIKNMAAAYTLLNKLGLKKSIILQSMFGGDKFSITTTLPKGFIEELTKSEISEPSSVPSMTVPAKKDSMFTNIDASPEIISALEKGLGLRGDKKIKSVMLLDSGSE